MKWLGFKLKISHMLSECLTHLYHHDTSGQQCIVMNRERIEINIKFQPILPQELNTYAVEMFEEKAVEEEKELDLPENPLPNLG